MTTAKKYIVTGGAGFIGSNLVRALVESGAEVAVVDDLSSGFESNLDGLSVRFEQADIRQPGVVEALSAGCHAVFHLAASVGNKRSIDDPLSDAEVNVIGTLRVLEAARVCEVPKVVISSSAGIFGELKTLPIREDHPLAPDTPYGCTKLCKEKLGLAYAKLHGLAVVCLRYFNVYGPNQRFDAYGNVIPIFVFQMLRGETLTIFGDGEQTRDFIHVRDVVQANLRAEAVGVSGAFNLGSGGRITINDLVRRLEAASGMKADVVHGPPRPGDVRDSLADIQAAREAFGFAPEVELEEGLPEYFEWARAEEASA